MLEFAFRGTSMRHATVQPKLFEKSADSVDIESVLLYALGDFQSRGKVLAGRELPLDRLHGAFVRAFIKFGVEEPSDKHIAELLKNMGADVREVASFVAKRPFRVTVPAVLAGRAQTEFDRYEVGGITRRGE